MENKVKLPTLKDFEEKSFGTWTLVNVSPVWNESENFNNLKTLLITLYEETVKILPDLRVLRAIVVTSDVVSEYDRLLEGTPRKSRVDAPRNAWLAGKVLTWGKCENQDNYYSVIVIDEKICIDAFDDNKEGKATIVHELTHIAEGFMNRNLKGNRDEDIYTQEWERLKFSKATTVFSEYFAQIVAYSYYPNREVLQKHINFAVTFLKSASELLNDEIGKHRIHTDVSKLWSLATSELFRVFAQIGRSIGLLVCIDKETNEATWQCFIGKIEEINPLWVPVVEEIRCALVNINDNERESFMPICDAIEHGFRTAGFIPEILEDGRLCIHITR